jgi:hypothetical protein
MAWEHREAVVGPGPASLVVVPPADAIPAGLRDGTWIGTRRQRAGAGPELLATAAGRIWHLVGGRPRRVRHVVYHSPSGLSWGSDGVGAADAALSMLVGAGVDPQRAFRLHRPFARDVLAPLPAEGFVLPGAVVTHWLESFR